MTDWKTTFSTFTGILVGDELVIDGRMAKFEITEKTRNDLLCKCVDPGLLLPRAKLSFGNLVQRNFVLPNEKLYISASHVLIFYSSLLQQHFPWHIKNSAAVSWTFFFLTYGP